MKVTIYSDGSCIGNPGPGGHAALILYNEEEFWVTGNHPQTTNNQMELLALIKALEFLSNFKEKLFIEVYTDSKYVQLGISEWSTKWLVNNWNANKVLNIELWKQLIYLKKKYPFEIYWIKSHSKHFFNELVDKKARFMANQIN